MCQSISLCVVEIYCVHLYYNRCLQFCPLNDGKGSIHSRLLNVFPVSRPLLHLFQVIADNVGDNVGDSAGMGSDLFGSFAESTCAALVIAGLSQPGQDHDFSAMCFPLLISATGILVCIVTTFVATNFSKLDEKKDIEPALKQQLVISTVLMTPVIFIVALYALPAEFHINIAGGAPKLVQNW